MSSSATENATTSRATENATTSPAEWRKPGPGDQRSPCPALNALANGGQLPREGKKITVEQLLTAMDRYFGLSPSIGEKLAKAAVARLGKPGPDGVNVLDLADLELHGFIEHDASLTRRDARTGNASEIAQPLVDQLVSLSTDGKTLTREDLAVAHQLRMAQSSADGRKASLKAGVLGTFEAALLFAVLSRNGAIAIPDLVELLQHERVPAHLSPRRIDRAALFSTAAMIAVIGNVPLFDAAKRAQKAAKERSAP